jgi:hypothetical protein
MAGAGGKTKNTRQHIAAGRKTPQAFLFGFCRIIENRNDF